MAASFIKAYQSTFSSKVVERLCELSILEVFVKNIIFIEYMEC